MQLIRIFTAWLAFLLLVQLAGMSQQSHDQEHRSPAGPQDDSDDSLLREAMKVIESPSQSPHTVHRENEGASGPDGLAAIRDPETLLWLFETGIAQFRDRVEARLSLDFPHTLWLDKQYFDPAGNYVLECRATLNRSKCVAPFLIPPGYATPQDSGIIVDPPDRWIEDGKLLPPEAPDKIAPEQFSQGACSVVYRCRPADLECEDLPEPLIHFENDQVMAEAVRNFNINFAVAEKSPKSGSVIGDCLYRYLEDRVRNLAERFVGRKDAYAVEQTVVYLHDRAFPEIISAEVAGVPLKDHDYSALLRARVRLPYDYWESGRGSPPGLTTAEWAGDEQNLEFMVRFGADGFFRGITPVERR